MDEDVRRVLVAEGDFRLLAAKRDASLIAYADRDHVVWAIRPGEKPARVIEFYDDEIEATFARDVDALVVRGNFVDPYLVYWTPRDGHWLIGASDYTGAISYGGAVLYGKRPYRGITLWRPHKGSRWVGSTAAWPLIQANGQYGIAATEYGLFGIELEPESAPKDLLAPPGVTRAALAAEAPLVAFLGEPSPPPDGSPAPPCCALHVVDLATHQTLQEEPAGIELFQASSGAVFFYGAAGQSDLRRITLDGSPSVPFGAGPIVEWFGASPDASRIIVRQEPFGDYEIGVSVQELGGAKVIEQSILRTAPVYFRHGSDVLVSGVGTEGEAPYSLALAGGGTDTRDAFPDFWVASHAPLQDDEDGILFEVAESEAGSGELRVGNVMTREHARVGRGIQNQLQVSDRRLVAEVRDGGTDGIYLLQIPRP